MTVNNTVHSSLCSRNGEIEGAASGLKRSGTRDSLIGLVSPFRKTSGEKSLDALLQGEMSQHSKHSHFDATYCNRKSKPSESLLMLPTKNPTQQEHHGHEVGACASDVRRPDNSEHNLRLRQTKLLRSVLQASEKDSSHLNEKRNHESFSSDARSRRSITAYSHYKQEAPTSPTIAMKTPDNTVTIKDAHRSRSIAIKHTRRTSSQICYDDASTEFSGRDEDPAAAERMYDWATWRMYNRIVDHRRQQRINSSKARLNNKVGTTVPAMGYSHNASHLSCLEGAAMPHFASEPYMEDAVFDLEI